MLPSYVYAADITKTDIALEATYHGIRAIDYLQTRYIAKQPTKIFADGSTTTLEERNVYLSKRPSIDSVNKYFIITSVAHVSVTYILRKLDVNDSVIKAWQLISIYDAGTYVVHNYQMGIKMSF